MFFALFLFGFIIFSFKENNLLNEYNIQEDNSAPASSNIASEILVPNLFGKNFDDLQKEYGKNQEFKICILKKELNDYVNKDFVISQIPEKAAFVKRGSVIAVNLSLGNQKRQLPKIKGDTLFEATSKLSKIGFIPRLIHIHDDNN